ncbi:Scr1 family TA system antitoxin-like transcriptional regulator [Actinoallomurus liliacearum]|uniref:Scr1 family TA system antitoxin-like transcriptional regulator n=1 Tax=Actinoallomurus liliacearum TaxID=1080073 RepID=UPI0031EB8147
MKFATRRPNVTVRVLPLEVGTHAGLDGPFIVLGFPEDVAPDVAYAATRLGDAFAESAEIVGRIKVDFESLESVASSPDASAELFAKEYPGRHESRAGVPPLSVAQE